MRSCWQPGWAQSVSAYWKLVGSTPPSVSPRLVQTIVRCQWGGKGAKAVLPFLVASESGSGTHPTEVIILSTEDGQWSRW